MLMLIDLFESLQDIEWLLGVVYPLKSSSNVDRFEWIVDLVEDFKNILFLMFVNVVFFFKDTR